MKLLTDVLKSSTAPAPIATVNDWLDRLAALPVTDPFERATLAGAEADRLGYAFVGGYEAALARLVSLVAPPVASPVRRCLAATESGGGHPRAITTQLRPATTGSYTLHGEKTFATLASVAEEILVVASAGVSDASGQNPLRIARVRAGAQGLTVVDRAPTPFAPEIPHAKLTLDGVVVREEDLLPGDGYALYLKPFRTLEDVHVLAASLGYLLRSARAYGFAGAVAEGAISILLALREVAAGSPGDPTLHLALAGLFQATRRLIAEHDAEWEKADGDTRDRWRRDLALLLVAEVVRTKRTEAAWKAVAATGRDEAG